MGTDIYLNKKEHSVFAGHVDYILPFGISAEELKNKEGIESIKKELIEDIVEAKRKISIYIAHSPHNKHDLDNIFEDFDSIWECLESDIMKLKAMYYIDDLIDDGYEVEVNF